MLQQQRARAGLDVGSHSVKYAALGEGDIVRSWQAELCPRRSGMRDILVDEVLRQRLQELLPQLLREQPGCPRTVITALQGADVVCQYAELPRLVAPRELDMAVASVARQYVPFPMEEVVLTYVVVPPLKSGAECSAVFVVAARRDAVQRLRSMLASCGLEVQHLDITPLALVREFYYDHRTAAPPQPKGIGGRGSGVGGPSDNIDADRVFLSEKDSTSADRFVGLVHVGFQRTQCIVMRGRYPYYARDFATAGRDFTYSLQMGAQTSWQCAEDSVRAYDAHDAHALVEPALLRWLDEVRRCLQHFEEVIQQFAPGSAGTLDTLYLSGGPSATQGVAERLAEHCAVAVVRDEWQRFRVASGHSCSVFKVAVGLALEE